QTDWHLHAQLPRLAHRLKTRDLADTVDMARYQMPIERIAQAQSVLKIDLTFSPEPNSSIQAFTRNINAKLIGSHIDHSHTGALNGDRIPQSSSITQEVGYADRQADSRRWVARLQLTH